MEEEEEAAPAVHIDVVGNDDEDVEYHSESKGNLKFVKVSA